MWIKSLKTFTDINTDLNKAKIDSFKLMSNAVFRKSMENVRKQRYI